MRIFEESTHDSVNKKLPGDHTPRVYEGYESQTTVQKHLSAWVGTKPGLWTLDWTTDWLMNLILD